ncbi:M3 family oligoendopeptidase [Treponema brennaborense]|uniref:Peptidase M3A and M3B thimet/oligopeptidase F n=1 Tax=Treponema brennaborense (strain DSM 12168 / CIP 105900 / DD5/3) TaxID=906968 RepID=F4LNW7_TREBD|nr:M3 family oligoendopeptidase [Treponema brennaborense]AEE17944.1 peptidase M3A and M3B thimet/oligopeptidase F [Treponema brennaborense DSM 12168]
MPNTKPAASAAPRWNLSSIYTDFAHDDYAQALAAYEKGLDTLDELLSRAETAPKITKNAEKTSDTEETGAFEFFPWLAEFLTESNTVGALEESLNAYAYASYSTDTTNTVFLNNLSKLEEIGLRSSQQALSFQQILTSRAHELTQFFTSYPQYEAYRFIFQEELSDAAHRMSRAEENLADDLERTGAAAWGRLHEQIISNLSDPVSGKTFNEIRNDAYSGSRDVRRAAWQTEIKLLQSMQIPIAAALNNLKGTTVTLNRRRGWEQALDRSLAAARMSRATLDALIGAIEDSLPLWRRYLKEKKRLLRPAEIAAVKPSAEESGCAFYDLFAPLAPPEGAKTECADSVRMEGWTFDQARAYIIERFDSFSADMGDFARTAFAEGWIDAEVRKGKVGGAYCIDFPAHGVSRVLSNFTGTFSDVTTLAHELGHAYHHHCITGTDYALTHYPMTLAETASIFAETIVMNDMIGRAAGFDKIRLTELHLQDSCQVLVDILCRFYFERSVFEERANGELSAEDFCRLMAAAQEKSYGSGLSDERHEYMWAVKTHYYSPDLDFYNFPYAFGLLFALGLYARYEKEGKPFARTYRTLLRQTGSLSCEDVCRNAGFDIQSKEFWAQGIKTFETELALLVSYEPAARSS